MRGNLRSLRSKISRVSWTGIGRCSECWQRKSWGEVCDNRGRETCICLHQENTHRYTNTDWQEAAGFGLGFGAIGACLLGRIPSLQSF